MIYYIDFDGTICPNSTKKPPQVECSRVLHKLKASNHVIVIFSCRSNAACVEDPNVATQEIIDYLKKYNLPYDHIYYGKPLYNYIIDDRSIGIPLTDDYVVDWKKVDSLIQY